MRSPYRRFATVVMVGATCAAALWFASTHGDPKPAEASRAAEPDTPHRPRGAAPDSPRKVDGPDARQAEDDDSDGRAEPEAVPPTGEGAEVASVAVVSKRASILDTGDPCEPLVEPEIPPHFERVTVAGVTVTWPREVTAIEPLALAHVVAGLLSEAARASGTVRRNRLTVVLHASKDELHLSTGTPEWASGVYDSAVHVVAEPRTDFGVRVATLRHEVMHAQLHAAVGCMPAWFNEGAAQYFSGRPPSDAWLTMLRERSAIDFETLSAPTIVEAPTADAQKLYAQSLAMVLYVVDRSGEVGLQEVVHDIAEVDADDPSQRARTLWKSLFPGVDAGDVRLSLAKRIFNLSSPSEIDHVFDGAVCCSGERRIAEFACRTAPRRAGTSAWLDDSVSPAARCTQY